MIFGLFKKKNKSNNLDNFMCDIPLQYKEFDLNMALHSIRSFYNDLNDKNKKILIKLIEIAGYFRSWAINNGKFAEEDIIISHEYAEDSICMPKVILKIKMDEKNIEMIKIGFGEKYKDSALQLADIVYKRQKELLNETQLSFEQLKNELDGIKNA